MAGLFEYLAEQDPQFVDSAENFANNAEQAARRAELQATKTESDLTQTKTNVQLAQQARADAEATVQGIAGIRDSAAVIKTQVDATKAQIDSIKTEVDATKTLIAQQVTGVETSRNEAAQSALEAKNSKDSANGIKVEVEALRDTINTSSGEIASQVQKAKDWATKSTAVETVGGTPLYSAKYWAEQALIVVTGKGVESFNGRKGTVVPTAGDYTAAMVGARASNWTPEWNDVRLKPAFATVALSGLYGDLIGAPSNIAQTTVDTTVSGTWKFDAHFGSAQQTPESTRGLRFGKHGQLTSKEVTGTKYIDLSFSGGGGLSLTQVVGSERVWPYVLTDGVRQPIYFGDFKPSYTAQDVGALRDDPANPYPKSLLQASSSTEILQRMIGEHQGSASLSEYVVKNVFPATQAAAFAAAINAQPKSIYLSAIDLPQTSYFQSLFNAAQAEDFRAKIGANSLVGPNLLALDQNNSFFSRQALLLLDAPAWRTKLGAQAASPNLDVLDFSIQSWALARMKDRTKEETIDALGLGAAGGLYYTKSETDATFPKKGDVYTKAYIDSNTVTDTQLTTKVNYAVSTQAYTKQAADDKFMQQADATATYQTKLDMATNYLNKTQLASDYASKTFLAGEKADILTTVAQNYVTPASGAVIFVEKSNLNSTIDTRVDSRISYWGLMTQAIADNRYVLSGNTAILELMSGGYYNKTYIDGWFLKKGDAQSTYLPLTGTAANSKLLDGKTIADIIALAPGGGSGSGTGVDAWTKLESDARYYSKGSADSTFLTQTYAGATYMTKADAYLKSETYTKTESNARFMLLTDGYTKAQSDSTFATKTSLTATNTNLANNYYDKTDSDLRYTTQAEMEAYSYTKAAVDGFVVNLINTDNTDRSNSVAALALKADKTSVYTKTESETRYIAMADKPLFQLKSDILTEFYTKAQIDGMDIISRVDATALFMTNGQTAVNSSKLENKSLADVKAYVLDGFTPGGQVDAYTKTESDARYMGIGVINGYYTKAEIDAGWLGKAAANTLYLSKSDATSTYQTITGMSSYYMKTQVDTTFAKKTDITGFISQATADARYLATAGKAADTTLFNGKTEQQFIDALPAGGAQFNTATSYQSANPTFAHSTSPSLTFKKCENFGQGATSSRGVTLFGQDVGITQATSPVQWQTGTMVIGSDFVEQGNSAVGAGLYLGFRNGKDSRIAGQFDSTLQDPAVEGGAGKFDNLGNIVVGNYCLAYYNTSSKWTGAAYKGYNDKRLSGVVIVGDKAGLNASRNSVSIGSLANHTTFTNTNDVEQASIPGFGSVAIGSSSFSGGQESLQIGYRSRTAYNGDIAIGQNSSAKGTANGKIATAEIGLTTTLGAVAIGQQARAEQTTPSSQLSIGYKNTARNNIVIGANIVSPSDAYANTRDQVVISNGLNGSSVLGYGSVILGNTSIAGIIPENGMGVANAVIVGSNQNINTTGNNGWSNGAQSIGVIQIGQRNTLSGQLYSSSSAYRSAPVVIGNKNNIDFDFTTNADTQLQNVLIGQVSEAKLEVEAGNILIGGLFGGSNTRHIGTTNVVIGNNMFGTQAAISDVTNPTFGANNVFMGQGIASGLGQTKIGHNNTWIGSSSGLDMTTPPAKITNTFAIGRDAKVSASNTGQLGDANVTVYANKAIAIRSDLRDKTDVRDTEFGLDFIMKLRPVDYRLNFRELYKDVIIEKDENGKDVEIEVTVPNDGSRKGKRFHCGLIAQEVQATLNSINKDWAGLLDSKFDETAGNDTYSVIYQELVGPMVKAIQEQQAQIDELKQLVKQLLNK